MSANTNSKKRKKTSTASAEPAKKAKKAKQNTAEPPAEAKAEPVPVQRQGKKPSTKQRNKKSSKQGNKKTVAKEVSKAKSSTSAVAQPEPGRDKKTATATVNVVRLESGVHYQDVVLGKGGQASFKRPVAIRYKGLLSTGVVFDTNMPRGRPLKFLVGGGDVIQGLELGVMGMREGGKRNMFIPSALGYGAQDMGKIPKNSDLIFEVELLTAGSMVNQRSAPKGQTAKKVAAFEKAKKLRIAASLASAKKEKKKQRRGKRKTPKNTVEFNTASFDDDV